MAETNGHTKSILTRDQILAAVDVRIEAVEVPEWDGVVYVRNLNGRGRDRFEGSRYKLVGEKVELVHNNTRACLLANSICDASGALLFTEQDIAALGEKNASALDRLFEVAQRLSGLRPKDLEVRVKNSDASPSVNSGS